MPKLNMVNLWQTNEERQDKYRLARLMGASAYLAIQLRDWRLAKIERFFGIDQSNYHNRNQHDISLNKHLQTSPAD